MIATACGRLEFTGRDATTGDALQDAIDGQAAIDAFVDTSCAYQCAIDVVGNTNTCSGAIVTAVMGSRGRADVDMTGYTELELRAMVCDPSGWVVHLADSPTCDGGGGDVGTSSNDAEVYFFNGVDYQMYGNDYAPAGSKLLSDNVGLLPASGCSSVELIARDQYLELVQPTSIVVTSPYALRINPPTDTEGTPDALWYVGINRTYGSMLRTGSGVQSLSLCLR